MRYVGEHEVVYDSFELGFPSVANCLALVYVTNVGLFGFHNLGGNNPLSYPIRAAGFAAYVSGFAFGASITGSRLYGASYFYDRYSDNKSLCLAELTAFASALKFNGKIRGFNLNKTSAKGSAFVKYVHKGDKCEAYAQQWNNAGETKGTVSNQAFHRYLTPNSSPPNIRDRGINVTTNVAENGLARMPSIKLRG